MKVLIIYSYFGTPAGSWSTRIYELSRRWVERGIDVEVLTAPYEKSDITASGFISRYCVDGINLTIINTADNNRANKFVRGYNAILFSLVTSYLVLKRDYKVLIASSGPITVGIPMILAKILRKKSTIFEVRDLWPDGAIEMGIIQNKFLIKCSRLFEKYCYQNADAIVTASEGMTQRIKNRFPRVSIETFPNACDLELFNSCKMDKPQHEIARLKNYKLVLYTGSLGVMDELKTAILAMEHFLDQNLKLIVIGEGAKRSELEAIARFTGSKNIHFLGLLPKLEVAKWYNIADASLVGFQDYEVLGTSSPNKMFDSFSAGVPIIQNTQGWIKSHLDRYGGGITVDYGSVSGYVKSFQQVLIDSSFKKVEGQKARKAAEFIFNRDTIAREYLELLKSISH